LVAALILVLLISAQAPARGSVLGGEAPLERIFFSGFVFSFAPADSWFVLKPQYFLFLVVFLCKILGYTY
jgi:hypothetical protein